MSVCAVLTEEADAPNLICFHDHETSTNLECVKEWLLANSTAVAIVDPESSAKSSRCGNIFAVYITLQFTMLDGKRIQLDALAQRTAAYHVSPECELGYFANETIDRYVAIFALIMGIDVTFPIPSKPAAGR